MVLFMAIHDTGKHQYRYISAADIIVLNPWQQKAYNTVVLLCVCVIPYHEFVRNSNLF